MRRAAKTDANQQAVVDHLRAVGWSVHVTSAIGGGFPDLVVGCPGFCCPVEIKDGDKPPSERKLTKDQHEFAKNWTGPYLVVYSPENAAEQLTRLWRLWRGT
jgi:hypothetical protein